MRKVILSVIAVVGAAVGLVPGRALAADTGAIETVVVTAEKRSEDIQSIPVTVQAFTAKSIADLGIKASTDLSQFTPNVDIALVAGQGNQPIITIRGVGLNDYDTNNAGPNGVYIDEVYLSAPASQTFQTFDLERIEVLKGPQGTLYGRNTSGGAINFISKKPTDDFTAEFHGEYGAFDTYQLEGAVGGQILENLDARVSIVKNGSGGFTFNSLTGTRENGANNIAGRAQFLWHPAEGVRVLLNVHGGSVANRPNEYRHLGSYNPAQLALGNLVQCDQPQVEAGDCVDLFGYGTPKNFYGGAFNRRQHLDVHSWGGFLRSDDDLDGITLTSITAFEHNDKLHPEDSDSSPNQLLEINFGVRSETFTQEIRAAYSTESYDWVVGLYYLDENLHQNQPLFILLDADKFFGPGGGDENEATETPTTQIINDQSKQVTVSYGAFGQGDYHVTDRLKVTLGARFTGETKSFNYAQQTFDQQGGAGHYEPPDDIGPLFRHLANTSFNFRVGSDYHFTDDIMAYASMATGFKSGGFNGSFLSTDPNQANLQLRPIKPENVIAYEVGAKSTLFEGHLVLDAAVFYSDYRNEQIFILVPVPNTQIATNVLANARKAHMMGLDLQLDAVPVERLTFSSKLGLLQSKVNSSEQITTDFMGNQVSDHGHQLPLSPHVTWSNLIDYKVPVFDGTLDLQLSANYKSKQYFDLLNREFFDAANNQILTQRPYWIENARIGYAFDDDQWEVAAFVRNLSGQKYFLDAFDLSFIGLYQGILGQPRTWGAEVNFHY